MGPSAAHTGERHGRPLSSAAPGRRCTFRSRLDWVTHCHDRMPDSSLRLLSLMRGLRSRAFFGAGVVAAIAPPAIENEPARPRAAGPHRSRTAIGSPERQTIAHINAQNIGRIKEFSEIFSLPYAPCPWMMIQPVQVDQMKSAAPAFDRHAARIIGGDEKVTQVQIFVKTVAVVEHACQAGHLD